MNIEDLYAKIKEQHKNKLPFVVYQKPKESFLHAMLQDDNHLYTIDSYTNSGFIFAPFDSTQKSIIIPTNCSTKFTAAISKLITPHDDNIRVPHDNTCDSRAKQKHIQLVDEGIKAIKSGVFKKVVLARQEEVDCSAKNVVDIFKDLLVNYPNAFVYCWYHSKVGLWLGATPETLMKVHENNFFTMALAGTQPYVDAIDVDWGAKEVDEQKMVVSYIVDGMLSFVDDIKCSHTHTHKAGTLLHLRTDITAVLDKENQGISDIINVLHPTSAVCGLPKEEAKSFIINNEDCDRKYYTGFLGELNATIDNKTQTNLYVNLRCMEIAGDKAILYVGGGITKDSDSEKEWEETVSKTETMKRVL